MKLRLKELRLGRNLTQQQLAEMLHTTHATIQRWEVSKRGIPIDRIAPLAGALGVHPGELFAPLPPPALSPDELELMSIARQLSGEDRAAWMRYGLLLANDRATGQAETTQNYAGDRPFGEARRYSTSPASGGIDTNPTLPTSNGSPTPPRRRAGGGKR